MNNLIKNKFQLIFDQDKDLEALKLDIISVSLPSVSFSSITSTHKGSIKVKRAGDDVEFGSLEIKFKLDEEMNHYETILGWIFDMANPKTGTYKARYVPASLLMYYPNGSLLREIKFMNIFPTSLSEVTFSSNTIDTEYQEVIVNFMFDYFEVV